MQYNKLIQLNAENGLKVTTIEMKSWPTGDFAILFGVIFCKEKPKRNTYLNIHTSVFWYGGQNNIASFCSFSFHCWLFSRFIYMIISVKWCRGFCL